MPYSAKSCALTAPSPLMTGDVGVPAAVTIRRDASKASASILAGVSTSGRVSVPSTSLSSSWAGDPLGRRAACSAPIRA